LIVAAIREYKQMTDFTLTPEDNGKNIRISNGDSIIIKIPENPVDGYKWEIDDFDGQMFQPKSSSFSQLINSEKSRAGIRSVSFTAQSTGISDISLKHWREWEGLESVTDRYQLKVVVTD